MVRLVDVVPPPGRGGPAAFQDVYVVYEVGMQQPYSPRWGGEGGCRCVGGEVGCSLAAWSREHWSSLAAAAAVLPPLLCRPAASHLPPAATCACPEHVHAPATQHPFPLRTPPDRTPCPLHQLMDSDLHKIIRSPQALGNDHVTYFIYQA